MSAAEIARRLGVSRQRIHQIFKGAGRTKKNTGIMRGRVAEYKCWKNMIARCIEERHQLFSYYGGRGISVCDRWIDSFESFFVDMGARPSPKHSIDRINNDGNYEPGNCRWATAKEQRANARDPWRNRARKDKRAARPRGRQALQFAPEMIAAAEKVWRDRRVKTWAEAARKLPRGFTVFRAYKMFGSRDAAD